jgi:hypothetical protein
MRIASVHPRVPTISSKAFITAHIPIIVTSSVPTTTDIIVATPTECKIPALPGSEADEMIPLPPFGAVVVAPVLPAVLVAPPVATVPAGVACTLGSEVIVVAAAGVAVVIPGTVNPAVTQ